MKTLILLKTMDICINIIRNNLRETKKKTCVAHFPNKKWANVKDTFKLSVDRIFDFKKHVSE